MQVVKVRDAGVVRHVRLVDEQGHPVDAACRFLEHLADRGMSPNTMCAYGYDLKRLFSFLAREQLDWRDFGPADALGFLGYLRNLPSRRAAQRLGLTVVAGGPSTPGTLLSPATVNRGVAAASSFYDWAIATEAYTRDESPFQVRDDHALARVPDRHRPFMGRASRQRPVRRIASVRQSLRLPRPIDDADVEKFLASLTRLRDLAIFLLMLDGGLRPGEVLSLQIDDISYGRRRVVIGKRDNYPRGARGKSRTERMVDLHEPRTLDAVSRYMMHERPPDATTPFVFVLGGDGKRRLEPLSYDAVVRLFARKMDRLQLRRPETTPHALRHTHATAMWEGGMRELTLQKRLGHASTESTKIYTRVSDDVVLADYMHALKGAR
ncbi:tyrosine-type recombinase/integrase [Nocardia sp. CNY236]|uniref:tyrosine-type recombinase/integrase n=1 Tax=Nocardia sp. CNY236 TaxID=1169152 RepID=UPI0004051629|nr:tyrosine-type recombinase/integrase [Nocardia sp. CNY236]